MGALFVFPRSILRKRANVRTILGAEGGVLEFGGLVASFAAALR